MATRKTIQEFKWVQQVNQTGEQQFLTQERCWNLLLLHHQRRDVTLFSFVTSWSYCSFPSVGMDPYSPHPLTAYPPHKDTDKAH